MMLLKYKKQVYRLANILDLLIKNDRVISIAEIAQMNQCTERTVYNDIYYLIDNWNDLVELDLSHSNLVSSHTSVGNIQFIYENIIAIQPRTKLLRLIIEYPNKAIEFYASEIDKSEQSTRKLFRDLDKSLKAYDIGLSNKRSQYEIVGEEDKVRFFIASFYDCFQRNFMLPRVTIDYTPDVERYFLISSKLKYFLKSLEESAALRYRQGYRLNACTKAESLEDEVKAMIVRYIEALNRNEQKIQPHMSKLLSALEDMGYTFNTQGTKHVMTILSHILYMRDTIYSVNDVNLHAIRYYMKNYSRVNATKYENSKHKIEAILAQLSDDANHVFANLIFNIDSIQPTYEQPKALNVMVYSDISRDHAYSLKNHLSANFPLNRFYVYEGTVTYRSPDQHELHDFLVEHNCKGVISTCNFPYPLDNPKVTVSSYLVGSDIGRIYDFFHELEAKKDYHV